MSGFQSIDFFYFFSYFEDSYFVLLRVSKIIVLAIDVI
jgi:hypothetical protein